MRWCHVLRYSFVETAGSVVYFVSRNASCNELFGGCGNSQSWLFTWYKYWCVVHWTIFIYLKYILHKNVCCSLYDGLPGLSETGRFLRRRRTHVRNIQQFYKLRPSYRRLPDATCNIIKFTLTRVLQKPTQTQSELFLPKPWFVYKSEDFLQHSVYILPLKFWNSYFYFM